MAGPIRPTLSASGPWLATGDVGVNFAASAPKPDRPPPWLLLAESTTMIQVRSLRPRSTTLCAAVLFLVIDGDSPAVAVAQPTATSRATTDATIAGARDQFFTSGNARLRFREAGRGDPVVLVHGLTRSLEDWTGVGDSLALDHRVIAFDVRGFGRSTRFKETRDFGPKMADDVVLLLDHLRLERAHLVGHSLGAAIVANVAARYPDRVASASLIAGPFREDTASFARDDAGFAADVERGAGMRRFLQWLFPGTPDSVASALSAQTMAANDPATVAAAMRSVGALMVPRERASAIRAPTLVAVGGRDPLMPDSRFLSSWWPRAQLLVVPEADHANIAQRREVLAAMRTLTRSDAARR